jgi:ABC-type nitrate/sulfonate/bicarbonate transport system substrate-binding protein
VLTTLQQGRLQAGVMSPPTTNFAVKAGFREIFNIGSLNVPFPTISVVSTRKFIQENPETILNVLRASSEATYLYKTRPDLAFPVIAKYMRVSKDDPELLQSHGLYGKYMNETLTVPLDGIRFVLNYLSERLNRPDLKSKDPSDFVDNRFIQRLESEGFFKKLSQK